jgi:hypothetical protein
MKCSKQWNREEEDEQEEEEEEEEERFQTNKKQHGVSMLVH